MEKKFTEVTYVICHNGADVIHPMKVEAGTTLTTGQPQYEEFATEAEWTARLTELGYDTAKLAPPALAGHDGPAGLAARAGRPGKEGRPGALLTPEERKALKPEERKALRAERLAAGPKAAGPKAARAKKA